MIASLLDRLRIRARALFRARRVEQDLHDELRGHLDRQIEELIGSGMPIEAARIEAIRTFGSLVSAEEACRDARGVRGIEELWQDIRYGLRMMRRTPGPATVIVVTLAVAIGANTALFSVFDAILLKALPLPNPRGRVLEPAPSGDPNLVIGRVVDVRILRDPNEPATPIGVEADRPALHVYASVAATAFADDVQSQAPGIGQISPDGYVRVGLSGTEPVVMNRVCDDRISRQIAIAGSGLDVVIRIEAEIPVRLKVGSTKTADPEQTNTDFRIDCRADEVVCGRLHRWDQREPARVIVVLVAYSRLIEAVVLMVHAQPGGHGRERVPDVYVDALGT